MFVFAKLIHFLIHPFHLLLALVGIGLALRALGRTRMGAAALWGAAGFLGVVSLTPLADALAYGLENRIAAAPYDLDDVAGAIVLGGATGRGDLAAVHETYTINDGAERLTTAVALRRRRPDLPLVFSGGSGRLFPDEMREPDITRLFLADMGVDPASVTFEDRSRNTYENAVNTAALLKDRPGRYLLITSAFHMPRALGLFRQAGVDVIPVPVDYRSPKPSWSVFDIQPWDRFGALDLALREWTGLVTYRLLGRTDALFPDD